jgi:hypothetical protein
MRFPRALVVLACAFGGGLVAQEALPVIPRIGLIDFYGRTTVPEAKIRQALGAKEGDRLPASKGDAEAAIEEVPGVVRARIEATCCVDGGAVLYIGIEEKGAPHLEFNGTPAGEFKLPEAIHEEYVAFLSAVSVAVRDNDTGEDLSHGHSLMDNPGVHAHQQKFIGLADANLPEIRRVLKESADEEQRAIAAYLMGYASDKASVLDDLQAALRDPDTTVRNNAMRSLGAFAVLAVKEPGRKLRVQSTWFIEALNSLEWQDRITAANILVTLTEARDGATLLQLRERALPALTEMASWKSLNHALPAFLVLGRVTGYPEEEIVKLWSDGNRQELIDKVRPKK